MSLVSFYRVVLVAAFVLFASSCASDPREKELLEEKRFLELDLSIDQINRKTTSAILTSLRRSKENSEAFENFFHAAQKLQGGSQDLSSNRYLTFLEHSRKVREEDIKKMRQDLIELDEEIRRGKKRLKEIEKELDDL